MADKTKQADPDQERRDALAQEEAELFEQKQKERAEEIKQAAKDNPARAAELEAELEPEPRPKVSPAKEAAKRREAVGEQHEAAVRGDIVGETAAGPIQSEAIREKADAQREVDEEKQELSKETAKKKAEWQKRGDLASEAVEDEPLPAGFVVPDYVPEEQDAVSSQRVNSYVDKTMTWIRDHVWQQLGKTQHEAFEKELKSRL